MDVQQKDSRNFKYDHVAAVLIGPHDELISGETTGYLSKH